MQQVQVLDRHGRRVDDDDDVVPDGGYVRVPIRFADALAERTRAAFADDPNRPLVLDLLGNPAGYRPGHLIAAENYRDSYSAELGYYRTAAEKARQDHIIRLSEAWKTPAYARAHRPRFGGLGRDAAAPPPLQNVDRSSDAACQAIRDEAYRRRCDRLAHAWKNK
jgi:hypothetical protein